MSNATYLFQEPNRNHHNSESFWTSFFALYLLHLSKQANTPEIPAYKCNLKDGKRRFETDGILNIPKGLDYRNVVVEGGIRDGFVPNLSSPIPQNLYNLKPDIIIQKNSEIIVIEVKTIGASIANQQKENYEQITEFLNQNGYKASLYFLISAGYEHSIDNLSYNSSNIDTFKLLIWEQIFKHIFTYNPESLLAKYLGDITDYYIPEEDYMDTW